jgi:transposase
MLSWGWERCREVVTYRKEFKKSMLQKVLANPSGSVLDIAMEAGIPPSTLRTWYYKHCNDNGVQLARKKKKGRQAEDKFNAVVETAHMSEAEVSEYCRTHGLYPEDLKQWREDCISGCRSNPDKKVIDQAKHDKKLLEKKAQSLEKELRRKDKALAEAAALLILKKKAQAIWGDPEEDE